MLILVVGTNVLLDSQVFLVGKEDNLHGVRAKGLLNCCNCFPNVFTNWGCVFCQTLTLVVFGISKVIDFASTLTGVSFLGCQERLCSHNCAFSCQRTMTSSVWCRRIFDTCAFCLFTIEDKLVWSSTCISLCFWFLGCSVAVVFVLVCVIAIILGVGDYITWSHSGCQNVLVTIWLNTASCVKGPCCSFSFFTSFERSDL